MYQYFKYICIFLVSHIFLLTISKFWFYLHVYMNFKNVKKLCKTIH